MSEFLKMDIFFFVTTLVVIAIGVLLVAILLRIWRILGFVEKISEDVSEESALLRHDVAELRRSISSNGFTMLYFGTFLSKAFKRFTGRPGKRQKSGEDNV
jgi:hypothetical protein